MADQTVTKGQSKPDAKAGAHQARVPTHQKADDAAAPNTHDVESIRPLSASIAPD